MHLGAQLQIRYDGQPRQDRVIRGDYESTLPGRGKLHGA